MASHINSIQFDNLFDVTLDIESYFSLSLPIPQCILSRDEEIKYWIEYINGQYHDLNMAFGSETNDVTCRGNQEHRLALEIQMRGKKHTAVSEIIQALESIKSFPPVGLELESINSAYKKWDELEFEIIELLVENPAQHYQSLDSDITSSPESWDDFNFPDLDPPQKYTTCSPMESELSSPCCRSMSNSSDHSTQNITSSLSHYDIDSTSFKNIDGKFECPYTHCFQTFPRQNALIRHFSSIHDDAVSVVCPFCPRGHRVGKPFNRSDNFQRHVTKQHPEVSKDDLSVKEALERLWKAGGVRTSWGKKRVAKKGSGKRRK